MGKIEQNKIRKRDSILTAAQKIFQSSGFIGSNMDKIAEQAGVTKQTVYRYFKTKEALFQAVLEAQRMQGSDNFLEALQLADNKEALTAFAIGFLKRHLSREHLANVRLLVSEGPRVPEITRSFYTLGPQKTEESLLRFLKDRFAIADGKDEINVFVSALLSMRMPVLTGLHEQPSETEICEHAERTVRIFLRLCDLQSGESAGKV